MKNFFFIILFLISVTFDISAKSIMFQSENYYGTVAYNDSVTAGDAIFARMNIKLLKNNKKKSVSEPEAVLQLLKNDKKVETARFYFINQKSKRYSNPEMLCGIPVSIHLKGESGYSLKIILTTGINGETEKEIILPVTILPFDINDKIIQDTNNPEIFQNMNSQRLAQTERLNSILETISTANIFSLKPFILPLNEKESSVNFGSKTIYNDELKSSYIHYGNDYNVSDGADIFSCADGKVVLAEFRTKTGWSVVIEHLPGLYSLYYHLSVLNVKEGISIKQGEKIGLSGATGLATAPHFHWEIRLNNAAVRPDFFLQDFAFTETE